MDDIKFLDYLGRSIILESLDRTGNDSLILKYFVIHEMTTNEMLNLLLNEQIHEFQDSDAEKSLRIKSISDKIIPIFSGLGSIAIATSLDTSKHIDTGVKKMGFVNPKTGEHTKTGSFLSSVGNIYGHALIGSGIALVTKFLLVILEKTNSVCQKTCKRSIPQTQNRILTKYSINVCAYNCRQQGINRIKNRLNLELNQCDETEDPSKCKSSIYALISKYDTLYQNQENLKSYELKKIANFKTKLNIQ